MFFAGFMALWAVLFLEFWKRRQFQLQHNWDMLGYETAEVRGRGCKTLTSRMGSCMYIRMYIYKMVHCCTKFNTKPRFNHRCEGIAKSHRFFGH